MTSKKGQAAIEYLSVVMISLIMISGVSYYFMSIHKSSDEDLMNQRVTELGKKIERFAEECHYSTGIYKKTIDISIPSDIQRVYVQEKHHIVFEDKDGDTYQYYSEVPTYGYVGPGDVHSGQVIVEKVEGRAVICAKSPCKCMDNETGYCDDMADNDCDGLMDGADYPDCCPDADNDNYADIDYTAPPDHWCAPGHFAKDCNGSRADINPGHPEYCDSTDHDCTGAPRDHGVCEFGCYLESMPEQNGIHNCSAGETILLSLWNSSEAHAEAPGGSIGYKYDLCCDKKRSTNLNFTCNTRNNCAADETKVLGFTEGLMMGSHVENGSLSNFPDELCCNVSNAAGELKCQLDSSCSGTQTAVASVKRESNSHIGKPGEHSLDICCWVDY